MTTRKPSLQLVPALPINKPTGSKQTGNKPAVPKQAIHPFDRDHGTETSGLIAARHLLTGHPNDQHVTAYYGVAPSILRTLVDLWLETRPAFPIDRYTFLDIGAGKGRAMLVASQMPFHQILGVELNHDLATLALANIDRFECSLSTTSLAPIRLLEQDATTIDLPFTPILAFLFHPFEAPVLHLLLRSIETQIVSRSDPAVRTLDLLYVNDECASTIDRDPAFTRLWQGPVAMSTEDHLADLCAIADQKEYGSTGDEQCAIYRYTGRYLD